MNRDDIIRMAADAGLIRSGDGWTMPSHWGLSEVERFAKLVAAAEREACAKVCAEMRFNNIEKDWSVGVAFCAEAVRARSKG